MSLSDPHKILDEQLNKHYPNALILKKPIGQFKKRPFGVKVLTQFLWFFQTLMIIYKSKRQQVIFREFDNFSILYVIFIYGKDLTFNVNHNLCSRLGRLTCYSLSLRFNVLMYDCPNDLKRRFPYLISKRSLVNPKKIPKLRTKRMMILVGNRKEQFSQLHLNINQITSAAVNSGFEDVLIVGSLVPEGVYLSKEDFLRELNSRLVINLVSYKDRHSGTVWTLIENTCNFFQKTSNVAKKQVENKENAALFKNFDELVDLIRSYKC